MNSARVAKASCAFVNGVPPISLALVFHGGPLAQTNLLLQFGVTDELAFEIVNLPRKLRIREIEGDLPREMVGRAIAQPAPVRAADIVTHNPRFDCLVE